MRISDWSSDVCSSDLIAATAKTMGEVFKFGPDERVLSYLPLAHVAERIGVEGNSLYHGFRVYFAESLDTFARDLQRARPTVFFSVPRLWIKFQQAVFAKLPKRKLDRLLKIPLLGRALKRKLVRQRSEEHTSELQSLMRNSY